MPVRVEIVSQGDEVLQGHTVDTNAAELARALVGCGLEVIRHSTVGDDLEAIARVLSEAAMRAEEVVCTGGLGPTEDDLTSDAVARAFQVALEHREDAWEQVQAVFARLGRVPPESNRRQARIPLGARMLQNHWGTAPGYCLQVGPSRVWCFPGVPREMRGMMERYLVPDLVDRYRATPGRLVTLRCIGEGESALGQRLQGLAWPGVKVGYRALIPEVQVKLRFEQGFPEGERERIVDQVRGRIGASVFGVDTGAIEEVVGHLLRDRGQTLAVAESCTGGRVASAITRVPGSSAWFLEGVVTYANAAKIRLLGVDPLVLEAHGAVSEPVARAMAEGVRQRAGSTWGLATTGVAGPGGGTPEKPVGTVHVAVAGPQGTEHRRLQVFGDREGIMERSAGSVLDLLRRCLVPSGVGTPSGQ